VAAERLFVDTSFLLALLNQSDHYHPAAVKVSRHFQECRELWSTEAILLEIGAALRAPSQRRIAVRIWDDFHNDPRCHVVSISDSLLRRGMELFRDRPDKAWSLADCTSFVVMADHHLADALTCDHHFVQAGFHALLLEEAV
jgi:uncharacterized protein